LYALIHFLNNRGPKQGELRVESQPAATVFLDDKSIGKTPYRDKIQAGEYSVKLVPDSSTAQLVSWQGKVTVGQNLLTYVNANLSDSDLTTAVDVVWLEKITSKQSELSVTTSPDGATVLVDDATRGVTPLSLQGIAPGEHTVSVTSTGFLTRSLKIRTTPGYRLLANLKLSLSGAGPVADASPSGTPAPTDKPQAGDKTPTPTPKVSPTPDAAVPAKPYVVIKDTPTGFLRVRVEPSTNATESGRVNPGQKFSYLSTKDDTKGNTWYQIKFDGTTTGWVSGQYTDKVE
jgi:hypothetical protein